MASRSVNWSELKAFIESRRLSAQWVSLEGAYYVAAIDGTFSLECTITKDTPECAEFEADYKPSGNRSPTTKMTQTLGEDGFIISPRGICFTADPGEPSTHYALLDEPLAIKGGVLQTEGAVIGDWIAVGIEDKDNVLGMGAGLLLRDYVSQWFVMPGTQNRLEDVSTGQLPAAGLYLRVIYHPTGSAPVKVAMNLLSWKVT